MLFQVDEDKCLRDGLCVQDCRLIEMKDPDSIPTPISGAEELCSHCGHCVAVCPTGALALHNLNLEDCTEMKKELIINADQAEQFLHSRRSVREYRDKPVEREKLNRLIQIAGYAPSAHNMRPVHFLIIEDRKAVHRLAESIVDWLRTLLRDVPEMVAPYHFDRLIKVWDNGGDPICRNAPHLVIAHAHESNPFASADSALAIGYLELAAMPLGLGATWSGYTMTAATMNPAFHAGLGLPEGHKVFGALMVGYPAYDFARMPKRNPPSVTWRGSDSLK